MEATASSTTTKKKALKNTFYGPVGGSFSQKKKVVLGNVKYSGDEKNISLNRSGSGNSIYSDVKSLSGENKIVSMSGIDGGSLLGSAATTPKKWIDPKVIKTSVEVSVKKSFALDINLSAIEEKSATAKTQLIKKIFLLVNGFGGAITSLKFKGIIRLTFTSEKNMIKTASLAREKEININSNLKKQKICSDWTLVIKKIPIDTPKEMIITALVEFGKIKLIKIQLIGMWQKTVFFFIGKDSVHVAMAVGNCDIWASRNRFRALLFTLPVKMTAHDLSTLLDGAICCAVIGFKSEKDLESVFHTVLIFGSIKLLWTRMDLVHCEKCEHFSHSALECNTLTVSLSKSSKPVVKIPLEECHLQLAKLYVKKSVPISHSAAFGGKFWVQVVLLASSSGGSCFTSSFGSGSLPPERSLELLTDQVSSILHRLNDIELVPLVPVSQVMLPVVPAFALLTSDTNIVLDVPQPPLSPSFPVAEEKVVNLGLSSSKVLTFKVGSLESKIVALEVSIDSILRKLDLLCINSGSLTKLRSDIRSWIINKFDGLWVFTSGLDVGFHDARIAIIMNNSLAWHVLKVDKISGPLISVCLLFKNKLSVTILGLYAAANINSMISKMVNSSFFVVLGGDFNKNGSGKSASFKFCLGLGLVNTFDGHSLAKASIWSNSKGVKKIIDFILVSENLASAVASHFVNGVSEFFDTNYKSVSITIGLSGLLDIHLISIHRQANWNWWKFKLKDANNAHWLSFKDCSSAKLLAKSDMFKEAKVNDNLNTMWKILEEAIVQTANTAFFKLFIAKVVKCWNSDNILNFNCLIKIWLAIDVVKASKIDSIVLNSVSSMKLIKHLSSILERPFHKMVLDHLVVNDELVIKPNKIKLKINKIMKGWTRKRLHCGEEVLACLLKLLNLCLSMGVSNVLCGDNFLVLKSTSTQSPIFAIGSIIEDALEKNRELWLMLQDMYKAYNSVDWHYLQVSLRYIKICECFIQFFSGIHGDWVRSSQASMQYILNIASEFFVINDILINNDKTVVIPINQEVRNALLLINGLPILIAKKSKSHQYLGIFLSTEGLSKFSLAQAHKDVRFFSNIVLRKAIMNKQFCYLVLAVLQFIVSYYMQFSFVTLDMCCKWNIMIRKDLRAKAGLLHDFLSKVLHHPFLYGLKLFEQVQSEKKLASLVSFSNGHSILGQLLCVSSVNNFLAGIVKIFLVNELSLANNLPCAFYGSGDFPLSGILGQSLYYEFVFLLKHFGVAFRDRILDKKRKQLNLKGPVPYWFFLMSDFMNNTVFWGVSVATATKRDVLSVLNSDNFSEVHDSLLEVWSNHIEIYTDGSLRCAGSVKITDRAAAYFSAVNAGIGVKVTGLLSSTLTELQAVVLALECVPSFCLMILYSDSQSVIDAYISEASSTTPDFHYQYILGNIRADALANKATSSSLSLLVNIQKRFLIAEKTAISGNEAGLGFNIVLDVMIKNIDWNAIATIWHPDLHMLSGFTNKKSANLHMYLIKTVYKQLLVVVRKKLYD
ncbi:hypothetical protein G9A89_019358 [Geosiphon pyriformis]|nr:hypothetical protein G9A89_019358 [Geosiphon pyriformis]